MENFRVALGFKPYSLNHLDFPLGSWLDEALLWFTVGCSLSAKSWRIKAVAVFSSFIRFVFTKRSILMHVKWNITFFVTICNDWLVLILRPGSIALNNSLMTASHFLFLFNRCAFEPPTTICVKRSKRG